MVLSTVSIKRPAIAIVISLVIVIIGALSFQNLPVREYPDVDTPTISVTTIYPGANSETIESSITEPMEEQLSAIDGIKQLKSESREQVSSITIEFNLDVDVNVAASDVRDRLDRVRDQLPDEAEEPQIQKVQADSSPIMWISVNSEQHDLLELSDIADRTLKQRIQTINGVANIIIGGEKRFAMRLWLDPDRLAALKLSPADVSNALREQNIELPGGRIENLTREQTIQFEGDLTSAHEFEEIVIKNVGTRQIKIKDVGDVELGSEDYRTRTYFNGKPTVGIGVVRQSQSNLLQVANDVKNLLPTLREEVPEGVNLVVAYDASSFVQRSVEEVYKTLAIAAALVVLVIFLFLRDWRATLIPLLTIPVSLIGTFAVMSLFGFTVNILTLLAIVLAVGLVVDDAIVMMENIYRRIERGQHPIRAALRGSREVGFAIIATTLTLIAVFLPVAFQKGQTGRLFNEFGITLAIATTLSSLVALTLAPMVSSRILRFKTDSNGEVRHNLFYRLTEPFFQALERFFRGGLQLFLKIGFLAPLLVIAAGFAITFFFNNTTRELTPQEDRGSIINIFSGPLGSTPDYTNKYLLEMDKLMRQNDEVVVNFAAVALGRGTPGAGAEGLMFTRLEPWEKRPDTKTQDIIAQAGQDYGQHITGGFAFATARNPLDNSGGNADIMFVIQGNDYDELLDVANNFQQAMLGSGIFSPQTRIEPRPNKPELLLLPDRSKAADLGVPMVNIGETLQTLFGSRQVTNFKRNGRQYDVILQLRDQARETPNDVANIQVRSAGTSENPEGTLYPLNSVLQTDEGVAPDKLPRYDRARSVIIQGQLNQGKTSGQGIAWLREHAEAELPSDMRYTWDGAAREEVESDKNLLILFGLALLFTYLILVAQFESWIHPLTIFTGIILAVASGLGMLWLSNQGLLPFLPKMTLNLYSQFGLILLIGLVAKNGILLVEFANQLRLEGKSAREAAIQSAEQRLRPILMTAIATAFGAIPLLIADGAGAESRNPLGLVVVMGVSISTVFTLFVVPAFYIGFDWLVSKITGNSSAHGLQQAEDIDRQSLRVEEEIRQARQAE